MLSNKQQLQTTSAGRVITLSRLLVRPSLFIVKTYNCFSTPKDLLYKSDGLWFLVLGIFWLSCTMDKCIKLRILRTMKYPSFHCSEVFQLVTNLFFINDALPKFSIAFVSKHLHISAYNGQKYKCWLAALPENIVVLLLWACSIELGP